MTRTYIRVSPRKLPGDLRPLVSQRGKISRQIVFVPDELEEMVTATGFMVAVNLFSLVIAVIFAGQLVKYLSGQPVDPQKFYGGLAVLACLAPFAFSATRNWLKGRRLNRDYKTGQHRIGTFILNKGILWHDGKKCTWIPRDLITSTDYEVVGTKGEKRINAWLVFKDEKEDEQTAWLPPAMGRKDAMGRLRRWIESGRF